MSEFMCVRRIKWPLYFAVMTLEGALCSYFYFGIRSDEFKVVRRKNKVNFLLARLTLVILC